MWNKRITILCAFFAAALFVTGCAEQSDELVSLKPSAAEESNMEPANKKSIGTLQIY
jgi:PBP1b-binding outer membrane lipoprotein LpoB